jgi:hypothetical protein
MPASLLSVNGALRSLYESASTTDRRSQGYEALGLGKPVVLRYLRFFLKFEKVEPGNNQELMVSTFAKTEEQKPGAAEAINVFDRDVPIDAETRSLEVTDLGGAAYGHELIYYARAYLGESIRLSTKVMELDRFSNKELEEIQATIGSVAGLPFFAEFLPYAALASSATRLFGKVVDLLNRDDAIIDEHKLDLHFERANARKLQAGRIVCVPHPAVEEEEILAEGRYRLSPQNVLIDRESGAPYTEHSYFVLQVNSERHDVYDDFDYTRDAAALLERTNRGGDPVDYARSVRDTFRSVHDMRAIREIEDLSLDAGAPDVDERIRALYRSMSPEVKRIYQRRVEELIG